MAQAKAKLNTYRQSPRKVRVVADLVRGKKVGEALDVLAFTPKRAAKPIEKLISSALANAKNLSLEAEKLVVKEIRVDGGRILYRRMPTARGRAFPIRKRTSHVTITLEEVEPKVKKSKAKTSAKKLESAS